MKSLLISVFIITHLIASAQIKTIIFASENCPIISEWSNSITLLNESATCNTLFVHTNNGTMQVSGNCTFNWIPSHVGEGRIFVFSVNENDTVFLGSKVFSVIEMVYDFEIGHAEKGHISVDSLSVSKPFLKSKTLQHTSAVEPMITGFSVIAKRHKKVVMNIDVVGQTFDAKLRNKFKKLKGGDVLIFYNIEFIDVKGNKGVVQPIELRLEK